MNPEIGQRVKIIFRNGITEEGLVENWSDEKSVIRSLSGNSILIIQNTKADIIAVQVRLDQEPVERPTQVFVDQDITPKGYEPDPYLRWQKMADLKREIITLERENARKHLTTFSADQQNMVTTYGIPRKIQEPITIDTGKKTK